MFCGEVVDFYVIVVEGWLWIVNYLNWFLWFFFFLLKGGNFFDGKSLKLLVDNVLVLNVIGFDGINLLLVFVVEVVVLYLWFLWFMLLVVWI